MALAASLGQEMFDESYQIKASTEEVQLPVWPQRSHQFCSMSERMNGHVTEPECIIVLIYS